MPRWLRFASSFRLAAPGPISGYVARTLLQTLVFWGFFLGLLPFVITALQRCVGIPFFALYGQRGFAVVLFVLCSCVGLWSGLTMAVSGSGTPLPLDTARRLVVAGPYAFVRNPMAIAGLGQGAAVGVWLGSSLVLLYVLLGGLFWDFVVRPVEEAFLSSQFGPSYEMYRRHRRCWIPSLRPYCASQPEPGA